MTPGEFTGPFTEADWVAGSRVTFTDAGLVAQDEPEPVVAEGILNGPAIAVPGSADGWMVPVFVKRDHGREPTTIFVASANVLSVRHPERPPRQLPPSMRP